MTRPNEIDLAAFGRRQQLMPIAWNAPIDSFAFDLPSNL